MGAGERAVLIENVMGGDVDEPPSLAPAEVRDAWGMPADAPLVLYTGTFEAYQGLDLLIDARRASLRARIPTRACWSSAASRRRSRRRAARADARRRASVVIFTGQQPAREIPALRRRPATCSSRRAFAAPTRR